MGKNEFVRDLRNTIHVTYVHIRCFYFLSLLKLETLGNIRKNNGKICFVYI